MKKTIRENLKYMKNNKKGVSAMLGIMLVCCVVSVGAGVVGLGAILK